MNKIRNMDVATQRRVEYTRLKMNRIDQLTEEHRKLLAQNKTSEEKLKLLEQRKKSLEADIKRLADVSSRIERDMTLEFINEFESPLDMEVMCAEQFVKKMSKLRILINEIIMRTCVNEKAMATEVGHQEAEFETRLREAIDAKNQILGMRLKEQEKCEKLISEHACFYEMVRALEEKLEHYDCTRWLLNVESRRVADVLDRTRRDADNHQIKHLKEKTAPHVVESVSSVNSLHPSVDHDCTRSLMTRKDVSTVEEPIHFLPKEKHNENVTSFHECPVHGRQPNTERMSENNRRLNMLRLDQSVDLMDIVAKMLSNEFSNK